MGQIIYLKEKIKKPEDKILGYRISFYTDDEIEITLLSLIMFGFDQRRYTMELLKELNPLYIKSCLTKLKESPLISSLGKKAINTIINNIEELKHADI